MGLLYWASHLHSFWARLCKSSGRAKALVVPLFSAVHFTIAAWRSAFEEERLMTCVLLLLLHLLIFVAVLLLCAWLVSATLFRALLSLKALSRISRKSET
jgi:hypothetical protein